MGRGKPRAEAELSELEKLEETMEELRRVIVEAREARRDLREMIKEVRATVEREVAGEIGAIMETAMSTTVGIVNESVDKARTGAVTRFEQLAGQISLVLTNTLNMTVTSLTAMKVDPNHEDPTVGEAVATYLAWGIKKAKQEIPNNRLQLVKGNGEIVG